MLLLNILSFLKHLGILFRCTVLYCIPDIHEYEERGEEDMSKDG